ncbi:MAG: Slp family lipoprotein [Gammaproteobacteria bacterium]|jgi:outer membrane lipoprotein|nr:Slp family lipoprotein [Gammaproteobacteria bacterium]
MNMHYRVTKLRCGLLLLVLWLSACASQVPQSIREAPAGMPSLQQVRADASHYLGQQVRWGGIIIETVNREDATWLTLLGRPLYNSGKPKITDDSAGRFIAIVPEFLDPQVYAADRRVTVSGTLLRTETAQVGDYPYTYPVVQSEAWYLWPKETEPPYTYRYPGWYDPWYYEPWYPPYAYPYRYWR